MKPEATKAILKKIPQVLLVYILGGAFCRWYQLKNELLPDGSLTQGAFMHRVLFLLPITFIVGFAFILYGLKKITTHKDGFSKHMFPFVVQVCAGTLLAAGNVMQAFAEPDTTYAYTAVSVAMIKYLPYLGILAGLCIVAFALLTYMEKTPTPVLYMLASIYLVVRLIVYFQEWNTDPSVHDYAYQLLAFITTMLGCFQIAGFSFGKGKRRITIFWCLCAAFFCAISVSDYLGNTSDLLINLSLLVLTLTLGLQLLYAPDPVEESQEEAPDAPAASEDTSPEF